MTGREAFWPFPRWLGRALDDGRIRPSEFFLLGYLGVSGLEHYGVPVTQGELARTLRYEKKTISRALHRLRDMGFIEFELKAGSDAKFRVTAGQVLRSGASSLYLQPTSDTTSDMEATSDMTSDIDPHPYVRGDLGHAHSHDTPESLSGSGSAPSATSDMGAVHKTETNYHYRQPSPTTDSELSTSTTDHDQGRGSQQQPSLPDLIDRARRAAERKAQDQAGISLEARGVGEEGFVAFVKGCHRLDVIDHGELLGWLALHGLLMHAGDGPTLDDVLRDEASLRAMVTEGLIAPCALCADAPGTLDAIFHGARILVCDACRSKWPPIARAVEEARPAATSGVDRVVDG